jgi:hypothetical protein
VGTAGSAARPGLTQSVEIEELVHERRLSGRSGRLEDAARAGVERYRAEIPDYADLDEAGLDGDVTLIPLEKMRSLLADVERRELVKGPP